MPDPLIPIPVDDPLRLAWFECNDFGNGRRLVELSQGLLKWVDDKFWVAFDGRRWSEREGGYRARALAHQVAQHIHDEAAALGALIGDPKAPDAKALAERFGEWCSPGLAIDRLSMLHRHAIKSGNAAQTKAMLTQAQDMPQLRAWSEDFDEDPMAFNVENGTLRFKLGDDGSWRCVFQEGHEPADMIRQMSGFTYDPAARCPQWQARFDQIHTDDEQREILAMLYGQSLTGLTDGEEFYTHQGEGRDGKSKSHEVLAAGFGDYYRHAGVKTWLSASFQKSGSEHRSDLVRLAGDFRFVVSEEPPRGAMWDSELLKQVTGGGFVTARGSGATSEITFKPRFKLHVEVNKLPAAPSDDRGWWARQFIVPWPVNVTLLPGGAEPPAALIRRLSSEMPGILNWLIEGCLAWLAVRKVPRPARVEAAIASARTGTSPIGEWIAEACDVSDRAAKEGATVLYTAFKAWCEGQGIDKIPTQRRFGDGLTDRQIYVDKDRLGRKVRCGIRLLGRDGMLEGGGSAASGMGSAEPTGDFALRSDRDPGPSAPDYDADPFGAPLS